MNKKIIVKNEHWIKTYEVKAIDEWRDVLDELNMYMYMPTAINVEWSVVVMATSRWMADNIMLENYYLQDMDWNILKSRNGEKQDPLNTVKRCRLVDYIPERWYFNLQSQKLYYSK